MSTLTDKNWAFQVVAHRGFSAHIAENTIFSFKKAMSVGATMFELDVRMTRDGKVVILHDPTLLRLGKKELRVAEIDWKELCHIDLHDEKARDLKGGSILTLEELFESSGSRINYYIEIKGSDHTVEYEKELCAKVTELVKKYALEGNVIYVSFSYEVLRYYKAAGHRSRLGYNFYGEWPSEEQLKELSEMNALLCPDIQLLEADRSKLKTFHERGFRLIPWVVNDAQVMKYWVDAGIDGITTDDPQILCDTWGRCIVPDYTW